MSVGVLKAGTLTRLSAGEKSGALRKDSTSCFFYHPPVVGESFTCAGPPVNEHSSARLVSTSLVAEIKSTDATGTTFVTESGSVYRLDIDPEAVA